MAIRRAALGPDSPGALPAIDALLLDLKTEPLSAGSLTTSSASAPKPSSWTRRRIPDRATPCCGDLRPRGGRSGHADRRDRSDLERFAWHEVADDFVYPGAPEAELRVRLAMLRRRHGAGDGTVIRLGPLALDTDTYRVTAAGPAPGPHVQGVRAAAVPGRRARDASSPGPRCSARSGATTSTAAPGPWTCTSGGCGPSSGPSTST